jgi:hypothetical protein
MIWLTILLTFLAGCVCGVLLLFRSWRNLCISDTYIDKLIELRSERWIARGLCGDCGLDHSKSVYPKHRSLYEN